MKEISRFFLRAILGSQIIIIFMGALSLSYAGWYDAQNIPISYNIGVSAVTTLDDGTIYALAGDGSGSVSASDSFYKYIAENNEWVQLSSLPEKRAGATMVAVNGNIYVFGGHAGSIGIVGTIFKYVVTDDSWETLSITIDSRYILSSEVIEGKVYLIGGYSGWSNPSDSVQVFDPETETVENKSSVIDGGGSSMASAVYDGKIYLFGGDNANNHQYLLPRQTRVDVYDPISDVWSFVGTTPSDIRFGAAATIGDHIYVTDGNNLMYYKPSADEWGVSEELPEYVSGPAAIAFGSRIYMLGTNNSNSNTEPVQIYMPYAPDVVGISGYEQHFIESDFPLNIELSASVSTKINKSIETIVWTLPDGSHVSGHNINYNIVSPGDYPFSIVVRDSGADITVQEFTVTAALEGSLNIWNSNESIPVGRAYHDSVAYNNHLYLVGGYEGGGQAYDMRIANIDASGTVSNWRTNSDFNNGEIVGTGRIDWCSRTGDAKAIAYANYLHVFTGTTRSSGCSMVHSAKINNDGSLGEWFTHAPDPNDDMATALSASGSEYEVLTYNGYVYLVGAKSNFRIRAARLGSDGSVSPFFDASSVSVSLNNYPAAIYDGYIYLFGQYGAQAEMEGPGISVAKINLDGTVGEFTYQQDHYVGQYESAVAVNGKLFMSGGRENYDLPVSDVYSAVINQDGTLGPITVDRKLPAARAQHDMTAYGDYIFVTGGAEGDEFSGYETTAWSSKIGATNQDKPSIDDQSFLVTSNEDVTVAFTGNEVGRALTYTVTELPARGDLSVLDNGKYRYEHTESGNGTDSFSVRLSDGVYEDEVKVSITINDNAPIITGEANTSVEIGEAFEFIASGSDLDPGDNLVYSINNLPSWADFDVLTGRLYGNPSLGDLWTTTEKIVITVSDGTRTANLPPFDLSVTNKPSDTNYIPQNVQSSSPIALNWNTSAFALLKSGDVLGYSLDGWTDGSGTEIVQDRSGQAVQVSRGGYHTVVLLNDGTVETNGNNSDCQLGGGSSTSSSRVTAVDQSDVTLTDVTTIAAGNRHTLALKKDGTVWTWGDNPQGQLGNGSSSGQQCYATQVHGLDNVAQIAAGEVISLALKHDGTVWIWGRQGGDAPARQLTDVDNIVQIAAGGTHSIALSADGKVYTWGRAGGDYPYPTNMILPGLDEIVEIASGQYHGLALKRDGTVWAWGQNLDGQIGRGNLSYSDYPLQIPGFGDVVHVSAGGYSSAAIKSDGSVWAWGRNTQGQLRDGTNVSKSSPIQVDYGDVAFDMPPIVTPVTLNVSEDGSITSLLDATDSDSVEIIYGLTALPAHGEVIFDSPIPNLNNMVLKASNSEEVVAFGSDGLAIAPASISGVTSGNDLILELALPNVRPSSGNQVAIGFVVEQLDRQYKAHVVLDDIYVNEAGEFYLAATQYALWALAPDGNTLTVQREPASFVSVSSGVLSINASKLMSTINDSISGSGVNGESGHYQIRLIFSQSLNLRHKDGGQYYNYPQVSLDAGDLYLKGNGGIYRTNIPWGQNTISAETLQKIEGGTLLQFDLIVNGVNAGTAAPILPSTPWNSSIVEEEQEQLYLQHPVDSRYVALAGTENFRYVPDQNYDGTDSFLYGVKSGNKYSDISMVEITVAPENDSPVVASPILDRMVVEDKGFSFSVPSNTFVDIDRSDSIFFTAAHVKDNVLVGDGSLPNWINFDGQTATFFGTPTDSSVGSYDIRVVATDESGADASSTFQLTVTDINDPPVIHAIVDQTTDEDVPTDKILFNISDIETLPDALTVTGVSSNTVLVANENIALKGIGSERFVIITPSADQYGETDITLTVSDGVDDSSSTFTLTVNPIDDSPRFSQVIQNSTILPGVNYQYEPQVIDPDHTSFTFEIINKPSWVTFDSSTGLLMGEPSQGDYGIYEDVRIRVTAGAMVVESLPFSISVGDEIAPRISSSLAAGIYNTAQSVSLSCEDDGSGCDTIYYTLDGTNPLDSAQSTDYLSEITVSESSTLKFAAVDYVGNVSEVLTISYQFDTESPELSFVNITDGKTFDVNKDWSSVVGTAVDHGSGLSNVQVMISDGQSYLTVYPGLDPFFVTVETPVWNDVQFYGDEFPIDNAWAVSVDDLTRNRLYTVTVRAEDNAGNVSNLTYYVFMEDAAGGVQLETSITQSLSAQALRQNQSLSISGQVSLLGTADVSLNGKPIKLIVTPPAGGGDVTEYTTTTTDDLGHYSFKNIDLFTHKGNYSLTTSFEDSGILVGSSASNSVLVGASAGYAILVHGKFQPTSGEPEGFASHKKSTNRIYQKLIERGFAPENIKYLNFDTPGYTNLSGVTTDEPTKAKVQDAIERWAKQKMNDVPAPLYISMVDHGEPDAFYIGQQNSSGTITPSDLNSWLDNLESGLGSAALQENRVVVLGACYSGSFVDELSKQGRTIVTSAAENERSYKGAKEPDGIRDGEFFIAELFKELGHGYSLKKSFDIASKRTENKFQKRGRRSSNQGSNRFFDNAQQHPLFDDNGDGKGSNNLSLTGDGVNSNDIYLGVGKTFDTNSAENPAQFIESIPTQTLSTGDSTHQLLWAKDNVGGDAPRAWLEIMTPDTSLDDGGSSFFQIEVDLPQGAMQYNATNQRWEIDTSTISGFNGFTTAGAYDIYYYVEDKDTHEVSSPWHSTLYKAKSGNGAPGGFNLISPANDSEVEKLLVLDWGSSVDPEQDPVTYTLTVATDNNFNNVILNRENITTSTSWIDGTVALQDQTDYYWKVTAIDLYGASTTSSTFHFQTNFTNSIPGIVQGIVFSNSDASMLGGATLELNKGGEITSITTEVDGSFLASLLPGNYSAVVKQSGSEVQVATIEVRASELSRYMVGVGESGTQPPTNSRPQISGTPNTTVEEGNSYSFTATGYDADGDALSFSVANLPAWMSSSSTATTFNLSGTPTSSDVGNYSNIQITVTDGTDQATLTGFSVEVTAVVPEGEQPLRLRGGWNLGHFSKETSVTTIKQQVPQIEAIWGFLNCEKGWEYSLFNSDSSTPVVTSDPALTTLYPGRGYWLKLTDEAGEAEVVFSGDALSTQISLNGLTIYPGWNSIGVSENADLTNMILPTEIESIWGWSENRWSSHVRSVPTFLNSLHSLDPKMGYYIYNSDAVSGSCVSQ